MILKKIVFCLLTTWLALLEILSMVSHTHWQNILTETPTVLEDPSLLLYCFRNRKVQSRYQGMYLTCNLWISCNKSQRLDAKKEDTPKLALKKRSATDTDVLRTSLAILLNWVDNIFIFCKCYVLKAKIELHESKGNCLIKSLILINDKKYQDIYVYILIGSIKMT